LRRIDQEEQDALKQAQEEGEEGETSSFGEK